MPGNNDWRNPVSTTGPGLDDYVNAEILAGRIVGRDGAPIGTSTLQIPPWPGNPLFMFEAWDIDGFGNQAPSAPTAIVPNAADAVVAATHTWTIANGNFSSRHIGGTWDFDGATNAANNGRRTITNVTGPTTIVTDGTQVNETFSTPANITAIVTGTEVSKGAQIYAAVNKGAQTNGGAATSWVRGGGNLIYQPVAGAAGWSAGGRVGNLPSLRTDGTGWMQTTPAVTALAQPMTVAMVFSVDSLAPTGGFFALFDALGASRAWITVTNGTGVVNMGSGGSAVATTAIIAGGTYNTLIAVYNGANSFVRLNGVQTAVVNPTMTGGATGMTLFALVGGSFPMTAGDCVYFGCWTDGTANAQLEAASAAIVGATPQ